MGVFFGFEVRVSLRKSEKLFIFFLVGLVVIVLECWRSVLDSFYEVENIRMFLVFVVSRFYDVFVIFFFC